MNPLYKLCVYKYASLFQNLFLAQSGLLEEKGFLNLHCPQGCKVKKEEKG